MAKSTGRQAAKSRARRKRPAKTGRKWSQRVTRESNALDLKRGVFTLKLRAHYGKP